MTSSSTVSIAFVVLSGLAVASGCVVIALTGAGSALWMLNAAGWLAGAIVFLVLTRKFPHSIYRIVLFAAPPALLLTLLDGGISDVHRWISVGPSKLNVAALVLPAVAVSLISARTPALLSGACGVACMAVLVLQPDASQATAFGLSWIAGLLLAAGRSPSKVVLASAAGLGVVLAWLRPDPLTPIPEVEGIVGVMYSVSPVLAVGASILLAGASAVPFLLARRRAREPVAVAAIALGVYFAVAAAMPLVGAYPVPLLGMTVSPILGYWLGAAMLMSLKQRNSRAPMSRSS